MKNELDSAAVDRARAAARIIAPLADATERARRLPEEAVRALVDAGVFKLLVPRGLGGAEASAPTLLAVLEEIARADGSAGWCAMIGASSGLMSGYLDEAVAREVYGPPDAITCGVFAPMGRAVREGDGLRVSGRWPFASGCEHSAWRMGGVVVEGEPPTATVKSVLFRADETRVLDTWDTSGLRGTGSHDLEVHSVLVPAERCFSFMAERRTRGDGALAMSIFGVLASGVAAVALGIARGALDAIHELARAKLPAGAKRSIAHRETVQLAIAGAEAKVRAASAFLRESLAEAALEERPSLRSRAYVRLAASHAARAAAEAVDLAYEAGGASSIYAKNPLQRRFRDVHVATQHAMVGPLAATLAGRVLLDVESDTSTL
ncbi:MAG: acyl-CoA dehydrogenase family protein [Polyangiaceae bacterium]|jgi:alkylation response protein AidB-like acyl-CoA dehydrogenase